MFSDVESSTSSTTPLAVRPQLISRRGREFESRSHPSSSSPIGSHFAIHYPEILDDDCSTGSDASDREDKTIDQISPGPSEALDPQPDNFGRQVTHLTSKVISSPPSPQLSLPSTPSPSKEIYSENSAPGGSAGRSNALGVRPLVPQRDHFRTNHYFREKKWDFFPELAPYYNAGREACPADGMKKGDCLVNVRARSYEWNQIAFDWAHRARTLVKVCVKKTKIVSSKHGDTGAPSIDEI